MYQGVTAVRDHDFALQWRVKSARRRVSLLSMNRPTKQEHLARRAEMRLPYAVLGVRLGRRLRRHSTSKALCARVDSIRAELERAAAVVESSDMQSSQKVITELALGLAYDVPMFTASMAAIELEARRTASPVMVEAFRAGARAFHQARLVRLDLVTFAARVHALVLELRALATLEPQMQRAGQEWPESTARTDPEGQILIRSVMPTNGPNPGTKALHALGSAALAA